MDYLEKAIENAKAYSYPEKKILAFNYAGISLGQGDMSKLLSFFEEGATENIELTGCKLSKGDMAAFAYHPAIHANLRHLHIYENPLSDEMLSILIGGLRECRSLEGLHLKRNPITDQSAERIAGLLVDLPQLKIIDLSDCEHVGNRTAKILAHTIQSHHLSGLHLSFDNTKVSYWCGGRALAIAGEESGELRVDGVYGFSGKFISLQHKRRRNVLEEKEHGRDFVPSNGGWSNGR